MITSDMLIGELDAPWDAQWIAECWPHLFTLLDADRGVVVVRDVEGVVELSRTSSLIDIDFDGHGLALRVFNGQAQLVTV